MGRFLYFLTVIPFLLVCVLVDMYLSTKDKDIVSTTRRNVLK